MSEQLKDVTFEGYDLASGRSVTELHLEGGLRLDADCTLAVPASVADALKDRDDCKVAQHSKDTPRATRLPRGAEEPEAVALGGGPAGIAAGAGSTSEGDVAGD